jgi:hypothetical protein
LDIDTNEPSPGHAFIIELSRVEVVDKEDCCPPILVARSDYSFLIVVPDRSSTHGGKDVHAEQEGKDVHGKVLEDLFSIVKSKVLG